MTPPGLATRGHRWQLWPGLLGSGARLFGEGSLRVTLGYESGEGRLFSGVKQEGNKPLEPWKVMERGAAWEIRGGEVGAGEGGVEGFSGSGEKPLHPAERGISWR